MELTRHLDSERLKEVINAAGGDTEILTISKSAMDAIARVGGIA